MHLTKAKQERGQACKMESWCRATRLVLSRQLVSRPKRCEDARRTRESVSHSPSTVRGAILSNSAVESDQDEALDARTRQ